MSVSPNPNDVKNKPFIGDLVNSPMFKNYEEFLEQLLIEKTERVFRKPSQSDEFSKDIRYKIGQRDAIARLITLNEEAKHE